MTWFGEAQKTNSFNFIVGNDSYWFIGGDVRCFLIVWAKKELMVEVWRTNRQREVIQLKVKSIYKKLTFGAGLKLVLFRMTKDWW